MTNTKSLLGDVFGKAADIGSKTKTVDRKFFKLPKDGSIVLRILPPFGSLKSTGEWSKYYAIHFGYYTDQEKMIPFQSSLVINRSNKMVEVGDAALDRINKLRSEMQKAKDLGNKAATEDLSKLLQRFNLKKAHYFNVMDLEGNIGLFSIPHKMYLMLSEEIRALRFSGIDPIGVDSGRYFVFSRYGTGPGTVHQVRVYRDQNDAQVVSKLTDQNAMSMLSYGFDLSTLYIKPTAEEIETIVKENGGAFLRKIAEKYTVNLNKDGESVAADLRTPATSTLTYSSDTDSLVSDLEDGSANLSTNQDSLDIVSINKSSSGTEEDNLSTISDNKVGGVTQNKKFADMNLDEYLKAYGLK